MKTETTMLQKILIGAVVGALVGIVSTLAHDALHKHVARLNGGK